MKISQKNFFSFQFQFKRRKSQFCVIYFSNIFFWLWLSHFFYLTFCGKNVKMNVLFVCFFTMHLMEIYHSKYSLYVFVLTAVLNGLFVTFISECLLVYLIILLLHFISCFLDNSCFWD